MREILFRGKRTSNGKWVEGFYFMQRNPAGEEEQYIRVHETDFNVLQETVGQFSGLTDRDGRKIFEGDIILYEDELGTVGYRADDAMFTAHFNGWCEDFSNIAGDMCEVIGNIYDKLELDFLGNIFGTLD